MRKRAVLIVGALVLATGIAYAAVNNPTAGEIGDVGEIVGAPPTTGAR
jgi:hypothetical protein